MSFRVYLLPFFGLFVPLIRLAVVPTGLCLNKEYMGYVWCTVIYILHRHVADAEYTYS